MPNKHTVCALQALISLEVLEERYQYDFYMHADDDSYVRLDLLLQLLVRNFLHLKCLLVAWHACRTAQQWHTRPHLLCKVGLNSALQGIHATCLHLHLNKQ
jgi:hypothetical protein